MGFCQCKNSGKNLAKLLVQDSGVDSGKYLGDLFFFACFSKYGILGACMYPFADTGIEDRKF